MDKVLIFRHQLFKVSEPFITQQSEQLKRFVPLYTGRLRFGDAPRFAVSFALEDLPNQRSFHRKLWQVLTRDPRPYINLIREQHPTLIHAHFGVEGLYALPLAKALRIPLITTFHGFDATTTTSALIRSGSPSWLNYALLRHQLAQDGALFLCVSNFIRRRVIELGFPPNRTHVHYIGIDIQAIQPRPIEHERPIILHVARLVEKKGTEYLIRAFKKVAAQLPETQLIIIGDGPLRASLETLVDKLELEGRVQFEGAQSHPEVLARMQMSAMLVLPSVYSKTGDAEGLGMVLLEAAAYGLPLVGTDHGGIPEVIINGQTGFLVPERDIEALATSILKLMLDKEERIRMGINARKLIEANFDILTQTKKLEEFYNEVSK